MATCAVESTYLEMSTANYSRKLARVATVPFIQSRKRFLSEQNDSGDFDFRRQLSNNETDVSKRVKTELLDHDSTDSNHRKPNTLFVSSHPVKSQTLGNSSSTTHQCCSASVYIASALCPESPSISQSLTTNVNMFVCQQDSAKKNSDENKIEDKCSRFLTCFQLSTYMTTLVNSESNRLLIVDCGLPLRHRERRIKDSFLWNVNDKLSRKRLASRGLKNFLPVNQLDRLDEAEIVVLYDDTIHPSSCANSTNPKEPSLAIQFVFSEVKRYDSNKTIYVLQSSFDEFHQKYPSLCFVVAASNSADDPTNCPTTDIESFAMTEILPGLFLGNARNAEDVTLLEQNNIRAIINISNSIPCYHENNERFHYLRLPCNDSCQENIVEYFETAFQYVQDKLSSNENVLVHCQAGISRSPTLVIGYLMKHHGKTFDQAYSFVREKRSIVNPNFAFLTQLTNYQQTIM